MSSWAGSSSGAFMLAPARRETGPPDGRDRFKPDATSSLLHPPRNRVKLPWKGGNIGQHKGSTNFSRYRRKLSEVLLRSADRDDKEVDVLSSDKLARAVSELFDRCLRGGVLRGGKDDQ